MWLVELLRSGFDRPGSLFPLEVFRILSAICCLLKVTADTFRGHFTHYRPHTYIYFLPRIFKPRFVVTATTYRVVYVARFVAAVLLLLGLLPHAAVFVVMIGFGVEVLVLFRYYANVMLLIA